LSALKPFPENKCSLEKLSNDRNLLVVLMKQA
jgi:hypothetical protein